MWPGLLCSGRLGRGLGALMYLTTYMSLDVKPLEQGGFKSPPGLRTSPSGIEFPTSTFGISSPPELITTSSPLGREIAIVSGSGIHFKSGIVISA